MTQPKFRCFIAMAFDHADTDEVYDKVIRPALESEGVRPVRVDRTEHNRNINDVIHDELRGSQLVIADLTYARPSVYYEAGFGERAVPVIYTVRSDHLGSKHTEPEHRVHFDVSMRNILRWRFPSDEHFEQRLKRRIKHVLKPIRAERERSERNRTHEKLFASLPRRDQLARLEATTAKFLRACTFTEEPGSPPFPNVFRSKVGRTLWSIGVDVRSAWPGNHAKLSFAAGMIRLSNPEPTVTRGIARMENHVVLVVVEPVPFSKLRRMFPDAHSDAEQRFVRMPTRNDVAVGPVGERRSRRATAIDDTYVHLIDGVKSADEFVSRLRTIVPPNFVLNLKKTSLRSAFAG